MTTSRPATSQAGPSTQPALVERLVLMDTAPGFVLLRSVGIRFFMAPRKVPTLLSFNRAGSQRTPPKSPNRLRPLKEIELAVGPSSRPTTTTEVLTVTLRVR